MYGINLIHSKITLIQLFVLGVVLLFTPALTFGQDTYLTFTQVVTDAVNDVDGLNGVRSIAISPDGKHIYAAAEGDFSVALFQRNSSSGNLTFVDLWRDGSGGVDGLGGDGGARQKETGDAQPLLAITSAPGRPHVEGVRGGLLAPGHAAGARAPRGRAR